MGVKTLEYIVGGALLLGIGILVTWAAWSHGARQDWILSKLDVAQPPRYISKAFRRFFLGATGVAMVLFGALAVAIGLGLLK